LSGGARDHALVGSYPQISPDDKLRIPFFPKEIPDERKEYQEEMLKKIDESRVK
jgi:hypothetical protein